MIHNFLGSIELERKASPILDGWYKTNFKNLIGILDVTADPFFQKVGIDKFLIFKCPNVAKTVSFSIDEKVRGQSWQDIIAETWSNREKEIPGWIWMSKADYIVYAFVQNNELVEPPRFIPTIDFVSAIKARDYPLNEAKNMGWTTVFKLIPKEDLPSKPPKEIKLEDFMYGF